MDIHKPKAAHSWREFAVEIGTIIVGILIALGLEQLVEWSHWEKELAETRQTIRAELAENATVLELIGEQDSCADERLRLLDAWADGAVRVQSANLASLDNRPLEPGLRTTAWDVAKAAGVVPHMPIRDRMLYGALYDGIAVEIRTMDQERDAWRELGRYAGKAVLTAGDASRLKEDIAMVRNSASGRRINLPALVRRIEGVGVKPADRRFPAGRSARDLCEPPK